MTTNADKWFSLFIRIRDCDSDGIGTCVTCGLKKSVKYLHCGHFIGRQHQNTRFDETNAHIQCAGCNTFNEGRKDVYEKYLINRYGQDKVFILKAAGIMTRKRTKFELIHIADFYKIKAKELAKEKNIKIW